jgi:Mu transposase, C-terminal
MSVSSPLPKSGPSYALVRQTRREIKSFDLTLKALGIRHALQYEREIRKLHTFHPGERGEIDYTRFGIFLYPNESWDTPVLFQTGLGIDHAAGVIKGFTVTPQPTAASTIRLYKNCVLPSRMWLPPALAAKYANEWDVAGIDRILALDNARDMRSDGMRMMIIALGIIVLCIPPRRGDLKGKIERTNYSLERMFFETLPGYIAHAFKFLDPRMQRIIKEARKRAKLTLAEFEELLLIAVLEFNSAKHPDLHRPRIQVYREGLEHAPPILLTGRQQIDSIFALSYTRPVTREGVHVETWRYNSPELSDLNLVGGSTVVVKVNPDDVRTALAFHRSLLKPMLLHLVTHQFAEPTPIELARLILARGSGADGCVVEDGAEGSDFSRFQRRADEIRNSPSRVAHGKGHIAIMGAVQAAAQPSILPLTPSPVDDDELAAMFGSTPTPRE